MLNIPLFVGQGENSLPLAYEERKQISMEVDIGLNSEGRVVPLFPQVIPEREKRAIDKVLSQCCSFLKEVVVEYELQIEKLSSVVCLQPHLTVKMLQAGIVSTFKQSAVYSNANTVILVPIMFCPRVILTENRAFIIPPEYQFTSQCYLGFILSSVDRDIVTVNRVELLRKNLSHHPSFHNRGDRSLCVPSATDIPPEQPAESLMEIAKIISHDLETIYLAGRGMFTPSDTPPEFSKLVRYIDELPQGDLSSLTPVGICTTPQFSAEEDVAREIFPDILIERSVS